MKNKPQKSSKPPSQEFYNLFVYGTLMAPSIWQKIVKGSYANEAAILNGFIRKKVSGQDYPGIFKSAGSSVTGMVYFDVSGDDVKRLDAYEGEEYDREKITATLESGKKIVCGAYVFKDAFRNRLSANDW